MGDSASLSRLFVAVDLNEAVRRTVMKMSTSIAESLTVKGGHKISWVRSRNLHVTVRFLGLVNPVVMERLRTSLVRPWSAEAFDLELAAAGTVPLSGTPRVLLVGIRDRSSGFERLFPELNTRIHVSGVVEDQMRFIPHVTVGRVRQAPQRGRIIREAVQKAEVEAVGWQVKHLTLYESRMTSSTPDYLPQATGVLRAISP
ncbi:MAG TPA: RNA 2',3'-cyclic phosphodiesterase [Acidobacteria bacterium]|nr:RNA 2',3'-cyclic phosphodiesterase [Acidobacteriota bacterium]